MSLGRGNESRVYKWGYEEGIIEDAESFLKFLKEENMTTKLRCGMKYLPVRGEYDSILAILTGKS